MEKEEKLIWEGSPSQWLNFGVYALCLLCIPAVLFLIQFLPEAIPKNIVIPVFIGIPALIALWKYLNVSSHQFKITTERIIEQSGVLNRRVHDIELYRVKDIQIEQSIVNRIFGLSKIIVLSSDRTNPRLVMESIRRGLQVREDLRKAVEVRRDEKMAREMDFDGGEIG